MAKLEIAVATEVRLKFELLGLDLELGLELEVGLESVLVGLGLD